MFWFQVKLPETFFYGLWFQKIPFQTEIMGTIPTGMSMFELFFFGCVCRFIALQVYSPVDPAFELRKLGFCALAQQPDWQAGK